MPTERTGYNNLTVEVYQGFSTTPRVDESGDLARAERIRFSTQYPAGFYSDAEFFVPRDPAAAWPFTGNDRLVIRNGLEVAWEGAIGKVGYVAGAGAEQGRTVYGTGWWGRLAQQRGWNKPWADNRLTQDVWVESSASTALVYVDRLNRLRFTPKGVAFAASDTGVLQYDMPTGTCIVRFTMNASLQEQAQNWELRMRDYTAPSTLQNLTTSTSAAWDHTLASPRQSLRLQYLSNAAQTPTEQGSYYGQVATVMMYSETGAINACAITNDIIGHVSGINSDQTQVTGASLSLVPFVTDGYEYIGDILLRAAAYGDDAFNALAPNFNHSESAATPTGEPVLRLEVQPGLDDYEYAVRLDEPNVVPPLEIIQDNDGIYNYIIVRYRDELNNRDVYITPDDNSALTDNTSVTTYGFHSYRYDAGLTTAANALSLGRRLLASRKDPRFYASGPLTVKGYIRGKNGNPVPASLIRAGRRVRIENFLSDEVGVSDAGLTFLITATTYNDTDETCAISCGVPDSMAVMIARLSSGGRVS